MIGQPSFFEDAFRSAVAARQWDGRMRSAMPSRSFITMHRESLWLFGKILVAGTILRLVAWGSHEITSLGWLESVLHALGDALIVAGILGATVDWLLKDKLVRDIGTIFAGWSLPQEIRNYMREIVQTSLVMRNYRIRYSLRANGDKITMEIERHFDVFNYGIRSAKFSSIVMVGLDQEPDEESVKCIMSHAGVDTDWTAKEFSKKDKITRTPSGIKWEMPSVLLEPQDILDASSANSPSCHVTWKVKLNVSAEGTDILVFGHAIIGLTITVDSQNEFDFWCDHPDDKHSSDGTEIWPHDRLFMPGQCLGIHWRKRPASQIDNRTTDSGAAGQKTPSIPNSAIA